MKEGLSDYVRFIDGLVGIRDANTAALVRQGVWHPQRASDDLKVPELLGRLSAQERNVIAEIIQGAADTAIHDVLVFMSNQGYQLTRDGVELPHKPFSREAAKDFVARKQGEAWPDAG